MRMVTAVLGGLAIVCAVLPGCTFSAGVNSTPSVSKDALQEDIADRLTNAGAQPESVICKEDLVGEVGKTTRCEVVMGPTNSFEPVVAVTGIDGSTINYEMTPAQSKDQLEKGVSRLVSDAEGVQVDRCRVSPDWRAGSARLRTATSTPGESNCDAWSR